MRTIGTELLKVDALSVAYGDGDARVSAVQQASFSIAEGERIAIVGESGSGKTTLALAIAGLLVAPAARIRSEGLTFDGRELVRGRTKTLPSRTPGMSMVFQDAMTSLDPVETIVTQFSAVLRGVSKIGRRAAREKAAEWLRAVGLHDVDRILGLRPYELSGGMRQRVMVALAICSRPRLLIADEPTSALDASVSRDVMDLLADMTERENASLLIVSHDIELCRLYADRIIVMYHGDIVDICRASSIEEDATSSYTQALLACVPTLDSFDLPLLPTLDDDFLETRQEVSA